MPIYTEIEEEKLVKVPLPLSEEQVSSMVSVPKKKRGAVLDIDLQQVIIWSEILQKPKALRRKF